MMPGETLRRFTMIFKKKAEFIQTECIAMSIAQWFLLQTFPQKIKLKNLFFTHIQITTLPVKKLRKSNFKIIDGNIYRALQFTIFFTSLEEWRPTLRLNSQNRRPFVNGDLLLIMKKDLQKFSWDCRAFDITINNFPFLSNVQKFRYDTFEDSVKFSNMQIEMINKYEKFFNKISEYSFVS